MPRPNLDALSNLTLALLRGHYTTIAEMAEQRLDHDDPAVRVEALRLVGEARKALRILGPGAVLRHGEQPQ